MTLDRAGDGRARRRVKRTSTREHRIVEQRKINPWKWQDQYGFSQGIEVTNASRVLYCAGQASVDDQGEVVHAGDMRKQIEQAFRNLETVLKASGFGLANVVRLNYYTTDVEGFLSASEVVANQLMEAGCQPPGTLLGISKLAFPGLMIEIEATAVK
jgi:enamine deaminase RidA (YjgF/YER057c/UK114 family)